MRWWQVSPHEIDTPMWLRWRHNDHYSVSNHQPHGCLLNRLFRHRWKKTSKLRVTGLCVGKSPGPVNSLHKGPVMRKMFPFDDVIMLSAAGNIQGHELDFIMMKLHISGHFDKKLYVSMHPNGQAMVCYKNANHLFATTWRCKTPNAPAYPHFKIAAFHITWWDPQHIFPGILFSSFHLKLLV